MSPDCIGNRATIKRFEYIFLKVKMNQTNYSKINSKLPNIKLETLTYLFNRSLYWQTKQLGYPLENTA